MIAQYRKGSYFSVIGICVALLHQRLCWALCALRAFDPAVAGNCWSAADAARLLQSALRRVEADNAASLALIPVCDCSPPVYSLYQKDVRQALSVV